MKLSQLPRKVVGKIYRTIRPYFFMSKTLLAFKFFKDADKKSHDLPAELIISLTSYPARYKTLHLTLKCLLMQTIKVDKVILWIAYEDFDSLPQSILTLQDKGLTILQTKDTRSYKKIIPTLEKFPDAFIVTVDDDIYYPSDVVENLLNKYNENPGQVIASRTHIMKFDENDKLKPYMGWEMEKFNNKNHILHFLTSGAGTLFPPNIFYKDMSKEELFIKLAPNADDVWLFFMLRLNSINVIHSEKPFKLINWPSSQKTALFNTNALEDGFNNDVQIANVVEYYKIDKNYFLKVDL